MNKNNLRIILAMLPIIDSFAFVDTVKCKNNRDNNCNNTTIVQKITINNNCNIINENKDHSDHNQNVISYFVQINMPTSTDH